MSGVSLPRRFSVRSSLFQGDSSAQGTRVAHIGSLSLGQTRGVSLGRECQVREDDPAMPWMIVVILLVLWLLGLVGCYAFGGLVHILLVIAVIVLVIQLLQGRRVG